MATAAVSGAFLSDTLGVVGIIVSGFALPDLIPGCWEIHAKSEQSNQLTVIVCCVYTNGDQCVDVG